MRGIPYTVYSNTSAVIQTDGNTTTLAGVDHPPLLLVLSFLSVFLSPELHLNFRIFKFHLGLGIKRGDKMVFLIVIDATLQITAGGFFRIYLSSSSVS